MCMVTLDTRTQEPWNAESTPALMHTRLHSSSKLPPNLKRCAKNTRLRLQHQRISKRFNETTIK